MTKSFEEMPLLPGALPLVGHTPLLRRDRMGFMRRLPFEPPFVRILSAGAKVAVANHPEIVQAVTVDNARAFGKSDMLRFSLYPLAGEGLFTSNGKLWRRQRKLMAPLFHQAQLARYADDMVACAKRSADGLHDGQELELARETTRITMAIAGKTLFDADTFGEADALGEALTVALNWTSDEAGGPFALAHIVTRWRLQDLAERGPAFLRRPAELASERLVRPLALLGASGKRLAGAIRTLDDRVQRMIDDRRASGFATDDLLTKLLVAKDEDDGEVMSDKQVRDEVLTLFVAGHETTATGLAWTIYLLAKHPEIQEALQREVDAVGGAPTLRDLPRLGLALRVFKEALRLYPPVWVYGRTASEEVDVAGYALKRRTNVLISPFALHRLSEIWPDPERFDPDRFLPEREAARHKLAFMPFGSGPRVCIGNHFAMMEAQLVLATLLARVRFTPLVEEVTDPQATLRPKHGMPVRVALR